MCILSKLEGKTESWAVNNIKYDTKAATGQLGQARHKRNERTEKAVRQ